MDAAREVLRRHESFLREVIQAGQPTHLIHKAGQLLIDTCEVLRTEPTPEKPIVISPAFQALSE
jgi:hypothetical protein